MRVSRRVVKGVGLLAACVAISALADGVVRLVGTVLWIPAWLYLGAELASTPERHWRFVNIGARVVGLWFTFGGIVLGAWGVYYARHPDFTDGFRTLSGSAAIDAFGASLVALSIGIFCITRRAYRPDLGDVALSDRAMRLLWGLPRNWRRPGASNRREQYWWTGDSR